MRTKHANIRALKIQATEMRLKGDSYPMIESALGVSRSTLSGWLSKLAMSPEAKETVVQRKRDHLVEFRKLASEAHQNARRKRIEEAEVGVAQDLSSFDANLITKEALLAMLYIGEGFKKMRGVLGLGNSSPEVMRMFIGLMREVYKVEEHRFRVRLHLRMDQDAQKEIDYWSKVLNVPTEIFQKSQFDRRTLGKTTWSSYHGVCSVLCCDARIQKRLFALCEQLTSMLLAGD